MRPQSADQLSAAVRDEVERLRALEFKQVVELPPVEEKRLVMGDQMIVLTTWHDVLPSGEHRLVAQASRKTALSLGVYLNADGIAVSGEDVFRALNDEELAPFR